MFAIAFMFLFPGFDRVADAKETKDEEEIKECTC